MSDFNRELPPAVPTRDSTFPNTIDDLGDTERPTQTRRKWRIEEDELLRTLHAKHGNRWKIIATKIPGRSGKACHDRWTNHLQPGVDKDRRWTPLERRQLRDLQNSLGNNWVKIARQLGRTAMQVKNEFRRLQNLNKMSIKYMIE
ncbi:4414_t:CDS:2 [Paraglomus brasilianum]|uniref:4414_t:CDS:1 n=1 Tax=Paraglomus brasilianum TaxID=144538 RepID=A0A9N9AK37_9GLOM|nr:4414_t:CDS:2 [Paraglomus brasilianum]